MSEPSLRASRRIGFACLAVTSIGWGLNWPAMKVVLRELPPLLARGTAGLAAGVAFGVIALALGQRLKVPVELIGRLVMAACLNVFAWMGFGTLAMRWLNVGQAALLVYTMPLWATLMAWPVNGERPTARSVLGLILCLAGLWTLFGGQSLHLDRHQLIGAAFAISAALLFAFGTVTLRPMTEVPPLVLLAWQMTLGCLPMLAASLAFEHPQPTHVTSTGWWLMLYMMVVPMGLCYMTWFAALRRLPATAASLATLLTPVIGVGAAAIALGEPLGHRELLALVLTLGGVGLALKG